jgi:hypothetical protein
LISSASPLGDRISVDLPGAADRAIYYRHIDHESSLFADDAFVTIHADQRDQVASIAVTTRRIDSDVVGSDLTENLSPIENTAAPAAEYMFQDADGAVYIFYPLSGGAYSVQIMAPDAYAAFQ